MQIEEFLQVSSIPAQSCVALGFFDGIHLAHQTILTACAKAKQQGLVPCVLTFRAHPAWLFASKPVKLLTTFQERMRLLECLGIERVFLLDEAKDVLSMQPQTFLHLLVQKLNVKALLCGFDFTFGANAAGTPGDIEEYCREHGLRFVLLDETTQGEEKISSRRVRDLLLQGKLEQANAMLSVPYHIMGSVVRGFARGRTMGFPTANLLVAEEKLLPPGGVYATKTLVYEKEYLSLSNIGNNPTFANHQITVETNLLDYTGDLYDKEIIVSFYHYIRPEIKFSSPRQLSGQISVDAQTVRAYFAQASLLKKGEAQDD